MGSPPRMRGKHQTRGRRHSVYRITPADAGKTRWGICAPYVYKDHPRGCGENRLLTLHKTQTLGSPPRMQGKHVSKIKSSGANRITPADAGKTLLSFFLSPFTQDHPRGCGENRSGGVELGKERGSPPRMRGKLTDNQKLHRRIGITPADAGKTHLTQYRFQPP